MNRTPWEKIGERHVKNMSASGHPNIHAVVVVERRKNGEWGADIEIFVNTKSVSRVMVLKTNPCADLVKKKAERLATRAVICSLRELGLLPANKFRLKY